MPSLGEQMAMPGSFTCDDLVAARLLLRPGRQYQESVDAFMPYNTIQEIYAEGLAAGRELVRRVTAPAFRGKAFVYVNNRFQGNAPSTIGMLLDGVKI